MDKRTLDYIRKYHSFELPGKKKAMQLYRAAFFPLNRAWPDVSEVERLKDAYTQNELSEMYSEWERSFPQLAEEFFEKNRNSGKFNICPKCSEIALSPGFKRCEACGETLSGVARNQL